MRAAARALLDSTMRRRARTLSGALAPHLPPGGRVLDVGSGTGHNAEALSARGFAVAALDVADMRVTGPPLARFDGGRIPFDDGAFDAALLVHVLQYTPSPAALLRECRRVARGPVVVVQTTHDDPLGLLLVRANRLAWGPLAWGIARAVGWIPPGRYALGVVSALDAAALERAAAEAGLVVARRVPRPWRTGHVGSDVWVLGDAEAAAGRS